MKTHLKLKNLIKYGLISFLIVLAFTMEYSTLISRSAYESGVYYYMDRIIESFFSYTFFYYLLVPMIWVAYVWMNNQTEETRISTKVLTFFFSIMLVLGKSFRETNTWDYLFFDVVSIVKSIVAILGYYFVMQFFVRLIYKGMELYPFQSNNLKKENRFFAWMFNKELSMIRMMFRVSLVIVIAWLPILILCYPGGSCVDVSYQIEQALGNIPFSTQQSIFHTLFLAMWIRLGEGIFHSYNIGLYLGIIAQTFLFVFVLSYSIFRLMRYNLKHKYLAGVLAIYCFAPIYSNLATMTIKDTLFCASLFWFVIELTTLLFDREKYVRNKGRVLAFILSAIFTTQFRNNGIYVILLTLVPLVIYLLIKKTSVKKILMICGIPILSFFILSNFLIYITSATTTSSKEMLSIPFQQTARYVKEYEEEVTVEEYEVLEQVFVNLDLFPELYDPNISDPVKSSYIDEATRDQLVDYFKIWISMGLKHPGVYVEAFLNLCYGWFDPGSNNWIRYEARLPIFTTPKYLGTPDKAMYYVYNFLNRLPILGLLENVGIYVWGLLLATNYVLIKKRKVMLLAFTPLYISLLVCIASPAFWLHPRYAFPIILSMPFLWMVMRAETYKKT